MSGKLESGRGAAPVSERFGSERGLTLGEVVVTATILTVVMFIMVQLILSGGAAQRYSDRLTRVTELTQDLIDDVRNELISSVRLFHDDAEGQGYLAALDLSSSPAGIAYRLPVLDENGIFEQETVAAPKTGNSLLFARHAWRTTFTATGSGTAYRVDVYRMVHLYLTTRGTGPRVGEPGGLDLVKWVSEPLADGGQIDRISDAADRAEVCRHLLSQSPDDDGSVHPRAEVVWLRNGAAGTSGTFRQILTAGALSTSPSSPRPSPWRLERSDEWSVDSTLDFRHHSIASVYAPGSFGVGRFSQVSTSGSGFPHGFETQIVGPSSARQVLVRLVVVSDARDSHAAQASIQAVVDARDL